MFNKKIKLICAVLSLSSLFVANSYAASQSPYFGAQLGYGNVHQSVSESGVHQKDTGVAGRLFAGYEVDEFLAYEMGWTKFSNATFSASDSIMGANATIKTNALDLVVKGSYPVAEKVKVFGKLGAAYVMSDFSANVTENGHSLGGFHDSEHKVFPTAGAGVSYQFNDNVSADVSYNRIQAVGNSDIESTDFVGVGLTYSIG